MKEEPKQEVKNIIETEDNILTRNKKLINELCETRDNYTFCLEVFEKIGRWESWHFNSIPQKETHNYWNIHCRKSRTDKGGDCRRLGRENIRVYSNEEDSIKDFFNTIINWVFSSCETFYCYKQRTYATDPNWTNGVMGIKVRSLASLL